MIRLDKYLSNMTGESRSIIKSEIKKGNVIVNGSTVLKAENKIDEIKDEVIYKGESVAYSKYAYYMFNKPAGCVSATTDNTCKTVIDYLKNEQVSGLFPVGRLDKDTEGLLIITNDGELAHKLLSPKKHVAKKYYARIKGNLPTNVEKRFEDGLDIGDEKKTLPARIEVLQNAKTTESTDKLTGKTDNTTGNTDNITDVVISDRSDALPDEGPALFDSEVYVVITEGRYHQVKRMFKAVGCEVTYLERKSMGGLELDDTLRRGEYRKLTAEEINTLLNTLI
ncbi:MAG: pseudouridine synthase [Lachnospiraceae bacterium]|nr:pseudouridine synthase [Lachnospiraceae bacterium]